MITFSRLEKKGNLGNQLFQIAATIGIAIANGQGFSFPKWSFSPYFKNVLPIKGSEDFEHYQERQFGYAPVILDGRHYDLEGWFQSEKYFDIGLTRHFFEFNDHLLEKIKTQYAAAFSRKTILLSIRRGDFVDHPDYFQLPSGYYIQALLEYFPDWQNRNLVILSDDPNYCRFHFSFLENAFFSDGLSGIEQLALGSLCDDFIISNSTFSWWCAWLGEKEGSRVIRPLHYFTSSKRAIDNDADYFPERWKTFDHANRKISLGNAALSLGKENKILEEYLREHFDFLNPAEIPLWNDPNSTMFPQANWILVNDCILPPLAIYIASIRAKGGHNAVFCLQGKFLSVSHFWDYDVFSRQFDYGIFSRILRGAEKIPEEILFICLPAVNSHLRNEAIGAISAPGNRFFENYDRFFSYAGKIKGVWEAEYFLAVKKRQGIIILKTIVKKLIRYKKK